MGLPNFVDEPELGPLPLKRKHETIHGCELRRAPNIGQLCIPPYYQEGSSSPPKKYKNAATPIEFDDLFSFVKSAPINLLHGKHYLEPVDFTSHSNKTPTSLKMIRSNGAFRTTRRLEGREFPFETFYANHFSPGSDILQPIEPNSAANNQQSVTTDSSGFIIPPTTDSGSELQLTPTPKEIIQSGEFASPHYPPFEAAEKAKGIRRDIVESQNIFTTSSSYLHRLMEERLIRWRPSESQMSMEAPLNGKHPFQSHLFDSKKDNKTIFNSLSGWMFKQKLEVQETSEQEQQVVFRAQQLDSPDFNRILSLKKLKPNSSNSILSPPQEQRPIDAQPLPTVEPAYTPRAIAFSEFQLNFNNNGVSNGLPNGRPLNDPNTGEDFASFEGNFVDIFDDIDNCILGWVDSITNFFESLGRYFRDCF